MRLTLPLVALLLAGAVATSADEALRIWVSPEMTTEPAWVTVRAAVEPDAENRWIEVVVDSETFLRSSSMELEGERSPRTNVFQFRNLPAGEYEVRAALIGRDGRQRTVARRSLRVVEQPAGR